MPKKSFKCSKCGRSFKMKAHLARHQSAGHGAKKKAAKKGKKGKRAKAPAKKRKFARVGRLKGLAARLGIRKMSLEQMTELIAAARAEARRKLAELRKALK